MQTKWPLVKLDNHIIESKETNGSTDLNGFTVLSVTNDKGFEVSENKTSADLSKYKVVKENFFAYNPYRINVGSIALSRDGQKGIVSPAYVVFYTAEDLDPEYLFLFLKSDVGLFHIRMGGKGSVRSSLSFEKLQEIEIPLPPLAEQKRIVEKIKNIGKKVSELETKKLVSISFQSTIIDSWLNKRFKTVKFSELEHDWIEFATRGKGPIYDSDSKAICLNQQCNRWNKFDLVFAKNVSQKWIDSIDKKYFTKIGDIIINSTGDGTVGRSSLVDGTTLGLMYDSHMLLLRFKTKFINPKFFVYFFNSQSGQKQVQENISAKTTKQTEMGLNNLMKTKVPILPIEEQNVFIKDYEELQKRNNHLQEENDKAVEILNALSPSILAKAFYGE